MTTSDHEVARVAHGMIGCTLPKSDWTTAATSPLRCGSASHPEVLTREGGMATLIRRYNVATGVANTDTGGYHETITRASMAGAAGTLAAHPDKPLGEVLDALMAGPLGNKRWLFTYWMEGTLMSLTARRAWIQPDLAPLPWPLFETDGARA